MLLMECIPLFLVNIFVSSDSCWVQVDERMSEISNGLDTRLQINEAQLVVVADDSAAAVSRLGAQLAVEAEALRAESTWGLTLQAEAVADEISHNTDTLRAEFGANTKQLQMQIAESLQTVRLRSTDHHLCGLHNPYL